MQEKRQRLTDEHRQSDQRVGGRVAVDGEDSDKDRKRPRYRPQDADDLTAARGAICEQMPGSERLECPKTDECCIHRPWLRRATAQHRWRAPCAQGRDRVVTKRVGDSCRDPDQHLDGDVGRLNDPRKPLQSQSDAHPWRIRRGQPACCLMSRCPLGVVR